MRTDMNPLLPEVCHCERPLAVSDSCAMCGHTVVPEVEETFSPAQQCVLICIRGWADRFGQPPRQLEWERRRDGFPSYAQVVRLFGTWKAAIRAAGFTPPNNGRKPKAAA